MNVLAKPKGAMRSLAPAIVATSIFMSVAVMLFAGQSQPPPSAPAALYDETKVPQYTLPDPLVLLNGKKVTNSAIWREGRRPEVLKLFETNAYGRTLVGR